MIIPETPQTVGSPSDPTGPSSLVNGVEGMPALAGFGIHVRFLAMVDQDHGIIAKYLLNPIINDFHFSGVILVLLVHLPIDIKEYYVGGALFEQITKNSFMCRVSNDARKTEGLRIGYQDIFREHNASFIKFLQPISPYHLTSIQLDIQYTTWLGRVKAEYVLPHSEIQPYLESEEGFTGFGRSSE